jgi:hypothetical protein
MKLFYSTCLLLLSCSLFFSCAFAPVNNQYEKAGTLKKGNAEFSGSYTSYSASGGGESDRLNSNIGFRAGYGISDKFDLKVRYERLMMPDGEDGEEETSGVNYFSIVPKWSLIPQKLALLVPVSHYTYKEYVFDEDDEPVKGSLSSITPQLLYTFTNLKNTTDFTLGLKADVLFGGGGGSVILGSTAGAGFSSNLNKWAIRPEVGAAFLGGGAFLSYGVGLQFMIQGKKNSAAD